MEFRVLNYFLTIVEEGSISKAAAALHVTQPTLSRQMKELEDELGAQLLVRGARQVTLTKEGQRLRKRAEEIVSLVRKTEEEFFLLNRRVGGDISIGGTETEDIIQLVAGIVSEFRFNNFDIRYHLSCGSDEDVKMRLNRGELDFGILVHSSDISEFESLQLPIEADWGILVRKDDPLSGKESISIKDIAKRNLISPWNDIRQFDELADWFGDSNEKPGIVATFNLAYNAGMMVRAGIGIAITVDGAVPTGKESELCFRPLTPRLHSPIDLIWKKNTALSSAAQRFLLSVKDSIETDENGTIIMRKTTREELHWPSKAVTVYVPASAGGTTDLTAHWICERLEKKLGQPFIIVNRIGDSGGVAADAVISAVPDGYTLMFYHNTMMTAYLTGAVKYKATDAMRVINCITHNYSDCIVVREDSGIHTINELITKLSEEPGKVRIGVEIGAGSHMMAVSFQNAVKGVFAIEDYGTDTERVHALLNGYIDIAFMNVSLAAGYVEKGAFRVLAVVGEERNPFMPDIPTVREIGYDFSWVGQFMAMFGQQGLPDRIVNKLNKCIEEILAEPEASDYFESLGFYIDYKNSEEATSIMKDYPVWLVRNSLRKMWMLSDKVL